MMTGTACSLVSVVGSRDHTLIMSWARTTMEELVGGVGGWLWPGWTGSVIGASGKNEEGDWPREEELKEEFYLSQ